MTTYNQTFKLSIKDIDLIEQSLRCQIALLSRTESMPQNEEAIANHGKIVELMEVLGTLHNQKVWYGQVHRTGMPMG